jgi:crossover junction endodeoxyribonuclease RuvC
VNFLGIDPGQSGGLVLLGPKGAICDREVMPVDPAGDLNRMAFINMLTEWQSWDQLHIFLERIISFGLSAKGALTFGRQLGMIEQIIWERQLPVTFVEPSKWTKEIHQGIDSNLKSKAKSEIAATRLFPGVNFRATERSKKNHDGLIDAALIAEYGRRITQRGN